MSRLSTGGLINRNTKIPFRFDGKTFEGFEGDTLASALLANDIRLMGRSFKYHRPRGVMTAGSDEPNALMQIGAGDQITPNVRATMQEIYDGLEARPQNRVGSLSFDLLAINDLFAPFFSAGFYYKTFMWPAAFWEALYEPMIRRAAGLGALSGSPDKALYEKAFAHCDLLVIGAGPAGLVAAETAAKAGARVILADEDFLPGGRLNSESFEVGGQAGAAWAAAKVAELAALENVRLMTRTTIFGAYDGGTYGALERVGEHLGQKPAHLPETCYWRIAAKRTLLCGGALERPISFRHNDRPGIMQAAAVRSYINRFGVAPGQALTIFTNNDEGHQTARDALAAGIAVKAVIDVRDSCPEGEYALYRGAKVVSTEGRLGLKAITLRDAHGPRRIETDCLAISGGWNPAVHLTCHMNGRPVWREDISAFVPAEQAVPGMACAGAVTGDFTTAQAMQCGQTQALNLLQDLGLKGKATDLPACSDAAYKITPFWHVEGKGRAWLDFQNDVMVKDVKQAHAENFRSVEHMKRYTTLGMATDQGKGANVGALAIMAGLTGQTIPETGTTTFRPPYTAVALGSLAALGSGQDYAPERYIPSHDFCKERGADMIEAGLWYRPAYFKRKGEHHWRMACDREVETVRTKVGVCDVTSLGKIDVQGPDAGALLDRLYGGMMSTLKVGRVRYGLMLREDGHVLDDGTVARFGADHFVITTTTAAAGHVMRHMEYVHQCLWPDLQVGFISVTDSWAQFAVAGPEARSLLEAICNGDVSDEALPFMAHAPVKVGGVEGRLFRISFSGELAYELAVPARFGDALMRLLAEQAEGMGGCVYGLEALNVMRIEKGFITHAEIDGRVTADDIGMGAMISPKKDAIGKVSSQREGLHGAQRKQMVGLKPVGATKRVLAGAHLIRQGDEATRENDQGYVTSQAYSPTLGHVVAFGFLENGRARHEEILRAADPLRDFDCQVEVCNPVFFDPEGGRLRG